MQQTRSRPISRFVAPALAIGLPLLFLYPVVFRGRLPYMDDAGLYFYPVMDHYGKGLHRGEIPLWNPDLDAGYPAHAAGQSGMYYPINLILYRLLPTPWAFGLSYILHLLLACVGMFWFLRHNRLPQTSSLLGASLFAFNGMVAAHHIHLIIWMAMSWAPLVLLTIQVAWEQRLRPRALAAAAIVMGLQLLWGHPMWTWMTCILAAVWVALLPRHDETMRAGQSVCRKSALLAIMLAGGVALAAIQLLPTAARANEVLKYAAPLPEERRPIENPRFSKDSYTYITSMAFRPVDALRLFAPNLLGSPSRGDYYEPDPWFWESCAFTGFAAAMLALLRLMAAPLSRLGRFALVCAVLGLFMAPASYNPLYHVFAHVPLFRELRVSSRYLWLTIVGISILAAEGHALLMTDESPLRSRLAARCVQGVALLGGVSLVIGNWCFASFQWAFLSPFNTSSLRLDPHTLFDRIHNYFVSWDPVMALIALAVTSLAVTKALHPASEKTKPGWRRFSSYGLPVVAVLELFVFWSSFVKTTDASYYLSPPEPVIHIRHSEMKNERRIVVLDKLKSISTDPRVPLLDQIGPIFGLSTLNGRDPLQFPDSVYLNTRLRATLDSALAPTTSLPYTEKYKERAKRLCDVLGVRWLIGCAPNWPVGFVSISSEVAENRNALPFVYLADRVVPATGVEEQERAIERPDFSPGRSCAVYDGGGLPGRRHPGDTCEVVARASDHVKIKYVSQGPAVLVVNQHWDPGWTATLNGEGLEQRLTTARANVCAMAVAVPAAPQSGTVEFTYSPVSFRLGAEISVAAWVCLMVMALFPVSTGRRSVTSSA